MTNKMKFVLLLLVCVLTLVGYLIGTQKSKHEVNERDVKIENLKQNNYQLKKLINV